MILGTMRPSESLISFRSLSGFRGGQNSDGAETALRCLTSVGGNDFFTWLRAGILLYLRCRSNRSTGLFRSKVRTDFWTKNYFSVIGTFSDLCCFALFLTPCHHSTGFTLPLLKSLHCLSLLVQGVSSPSVNETLRLRSPAQPLVPARNGFAHSWKQTTWSASRRSECHAEFAGCGCRTVCHLSANDVEF